MSNHLQRLAANAVIRRIRMGPVMTSWYEFQQCPSDMPMNATPNTEYLEQQKNDLNQLDTFIREMDKYGRMRGCNLYEYPNDGTEELN